MPDSSSSADLSTLQWRLLEAFFARCGDFYLTRGAALTGFYLHHRVTDDLDLFAPPTVDLNNGVRALRSAAASLGARCEQLQDTPDFRRFSVDTGTAVTIVDLVIDRVPAIVEDKPLLGSIRIDPLREIAANKLCALLGRAELRDLIDLELVLHQGLDLASILADAQTKDGGADPGTLAWVLAAFVVPPAVAARFGRDAADLERFRDELVSRLTALALPAP